MKLIIKSSVRRDLDEIARYIAQDNPRRADTFANEIITKIQTVADCPLSYPIRQEWKGELRSAVHQQYHVIYRVEGEAVIILRVLHGARDIPDLL